MKSDLPKTELTNELHNKNTELHNNSGENDQKVTSLTNEKIDKILTKYFNDCWTEFQDMDYPTIYKTKAHAEVKKSLATLIHQAEITRLKQIKSLAIESDNGHGYIRTEFLLSELEALEKEIVE